MSLTIIVLAGAGAAAGGWVLVRFRRRPARVSLLDQAELQQKASDETAVMPPERVLLGPYELVKLLGQGNMATVYQARDTRDGSVLALKVVSQEHRSDRDFRRRFQREVELSQPLKHPNLVAVYEAVKLEEDLFLTMEYVEGQLLEDMIRAGPLELERFRKLAWQMLAGLHFAHKRHLFHRDIKPANIMVTGADEVKIFDFGLAIEEGQQRFTHMGFSMGTPSHMAPEMLTQGISNALTDQYALGVVFYQMLSGRCPFEARNPMELGLKHVQEAPPPLLQYRPDLPLGLQELVLRMLSKEPQQRFNDLAQIQTLLSHSE